MKLLFKTSKDTLYTISTLILFLMIIFPPTYRFYSDDSGSKEYEFVLSIKSYHLIDTGTLFVQILALACVTFTLKRLIHKSS